MNGRKADRSPAAPGMMSPPPSSLDSPSAQFLTESQRKRASQLPDGADSPSRKLVLEFSRMLLDSDRKFHEKLDRDAAEQQEKHREGLARAAEEHERVRIRAEQVREKAELELEREMRRRDESIRHEVERLKKEKEADEQRRKLAELRQAEEEQKRAAEQRKAVADAEARVNAQRQAQAAEEAKRKAEHAERDRQAREAAAAAQKAESQKPAQPAFTKQPQPAPPQPAPSNGPAPTTRSAPAMTTASTASSPLVSSRAQLDAVHNQYLDLHKRLKTFRKDFEKMLKDRYGPALKNEISGMRRFIKTKLGQIIAQQSANTEQIKAIRAKMAEVQNYSQLPTTDARQWMINPPADLNAQTAQVPELLIYLFSHLTKGIVTQLCAEAGLRPAMADQVGVVAVSIFGNLAFCVDRRHPLSDILLAKYHHECGVLFGISGPENLESGRRRLGWRFEDGAFVPQQAHMQRMTGLGAGWAALTLRKVKPGSALVHPFPTSNYWRALARIVDTPRQEVTSTHFVVLRALVCESVEKFIEAYGHAAKVALRKALVEFPSGHEAVTAKSVLSVPHALKTELHLTL